MTAADATTMTCRQLVDFLADYVAGTLDSLVRVSFEAHVGECTACSDYVRTYRETIGLARAAGRDEATVAAMPPELVDAIIAAARRRR